MLFKTIITAIAVMSTYVAFSIAASGTITVTIVSALLKKSAFFIGDMGN